MPELLARIEEKILFSAGSASGEAAEKRLQRRAGPKFQRNENRVAPKKNLNFVENCK